MAEASQPIADPPLTLTSVLDDSKPGYMQPRVILHVEDNEADAFLLSYAIERVAAPLQVQWVKNGTEAIDYLSGSGPYQDRSRFPWPELVLLDVNLPALNGFEVLNWARKQPQLQKLPIVMLSSSNLEENVQRAKQLGANRYVVKSSDFRQAVEAVSCIVAGSHAPENSHTTGGAPNFRPRMKGQPKK